MTEILNEPSINGITKTEWVHPGRRYAEEHDNDIHELMILLEGKY
jgi:hypothetical protein